MWVAVHNLAGLHVHNGRSATAEHEKQNPKSPKRIVNPGALLLARVLDGDVGGGVVDRRRRKKSELIAAETERVDRDVQFGTEDVHIKLLFAELVKAKIVQNLCVLLVVHDGEIEFTIFVVYVQQSRIFVPQVVLKESDHIASLIVGSVIGLLHAKLKNVRDLMAKDVFIFERFFWVARIQISLVLQERQ